MDTFAIVRTEHLNAEGYLFGGQMLKWVDEFAWLVAQRDFSGYALVTRGMDQIDFQTPVYNGAILRFNVGHHSQGNTSVTYKVAVYSDERGSKKERQVFTTLVTFVSVDKSGKKQTLPRQPYLRSAAAEDCPESTWL